jgi:hypothetical protein
MEAAPAESRNWKDGDIILRGETQRIRRVMERSITPIPHYGRGGQKQKLPAWAYGAERQAVH